MWQSKPPEQILVIQTAFLGDAVLATGVVEELHEAFPQALIDFLVRDNYTSLFQDQPTIRTVYGLNKGKGKYQALTSLRKQLKSRSYNLVVNLQRYPSSGYLATSIGADYVVGYTQNPFSRYYDSSTKYQLEDDNVLHPHHETERNHQLVAGITNRSRKDAKLHIDELLLARSKQLAPFKEFVVVAPASVWYTKQLPVVQWERVIRNFEVPVVLLGSATDIELCYKLESELTNKEVLSLAGKTNLLESAAVIKRAKHVHANDSAPTHIATAVGTPITTYFLSTSPNYGFGPLPYQGKIVEIDYPLYCRPCTTHGRRACPEGHFRCAMDIKLPA